VRSEVPRKAPPMQRVREPSQDTWPPVDLPAVWRPARSPVARRAAVDPATASRFLDS
jgi:hypothetical protein